uniref:Uncharacterized protein n=1 Tax=Ignisphaera aggregans TaxID=334771 RepID=A0A7C2ZC25_9CREN
MPELVIVVSDPRVKTPRVVPVRVVGIEDLEYSEKHKEQRALPNVKVNPRLLEILKPPLGIVVIRIWKKQSQQREGIPRS